MKLLHSLASLIRLTFLISLLALLSSCVSGDGNIYFNSYDRLQPIKRLENQISSSTHTHYGQAILAYDLLDLGRSKHFTHTGGPQISNLYLYLTSHDMSEEKFEHTINRLTQITIAKTKNAERTRYLLNSNANNRIRDLAIMLMGLDRRLSKSKLYLGPVKNLLTILKHNEAKLSKMTLSEKLHCLQQANDIIQRLPLSRPIYHAKITDRFRMRPGSFTKKRRMHRGIDLAGRKSSDIFASSTGYVKFAGKMGSYGNLVIVDNGHGVSTYYAHLRKIGVRMGRKVALGERIGIQGNTGSSRGEHLHYEIRINDRPINPELIRGF